MLQKMMQHFQYGLIFNVIKYPNYNTMVIYLDLLVKGIVSD